MANPIDENPIAVDYTSRDFYSLREDLITRIKSSLPNWSGTETADFGTALVESFAYMGDVINYYIDRVANESYLPTATQRQSILNLARNYGYFPAGYRAASVDMQFINENDQADALLPAGSQFLASVDSGDVAVDLIYTLQEDVTVPARVGDTLGITTSVAMNYEDISLRPENAAEGVGDIDGELLAVSNGQPEQVYRLEESQVLETSVRIWVQDGETFTEWTRVDHIVDYGRYDQVFEVTYDANDFVYVQFGDGVSGAIPNQYSVIKAAYFVGGGAEGNIAQNLVNELYRIPGLSDAQVSSLSTTLTVTNISAGVGGQSPENNASIKENAPLALTALNRAVSLKDYSSLALQVADVGKAKAVADVWTSVTVYVGPQRNENSVDQFPGYTDDPNNGGVLLPEWYEIQEGVQVFFADKTQIGTSVTVSPPTYVPVSVEVFYSYYPQYQEVNLETAILKTILDDFNYNNSDFGQVIHPEEIEAKIRAIPGIKNARIESLYRTGEAAERGILIGEPNEIFVFLTDDTVISPYSTNAFLSSLATNTGTIAPTFSQSFFNYSIAAPNGTTSITFTANTASTSAVLKINGDIVTSGTNKIVSTPIGVTNVSILVIAADGVTINEYVVAITRTL